MPNTQLKAATFYIVNYDLYYKVWPNMHYLVEVLITIFVYIV